MLGISVYLGDESFTHLKPYIERLSKNGFAAIFTSLHIPEDNPRLYKERLQQLGNWAQQFDMELVADIAPQSLAHLGFDWHNAEGLLDWGVTGLRIDYGVDDQIIAALSHKMKIALNASTLTKEGLAALVESGMQKETVEMWHNFYPRPETGLDAMEFVKTNLWLKSEGLTVMAFIPGDKTLRGPLYKGLPTLEEHRGMAPFEAYLYLKENGAVDKVLIGDITLSEKSLQQFEMFGQGIISLRAKNFVQLDEMPAQTNRWDAARDCIRSMESRQYGLIGTHLLKSENTIFRSKGSITVDNEQYGRYRGELQITKRDLPADDKVNVIGKVIEEDLALLAFIKGGVKFQIKWI
ncbi:cell surface protein [Planococcus kocurii]|uniref:Cell surface protein n=1 Tax=Planococcus kocurii TaxID=1374 RepID=A0AAC9F2A5_9BACL|nr:MupG family TIM beta-alpha barrel fold protein [Planococcus kocurii]ALS79675.1 cell surface protein [Planococcus kocurii]